MLSTSPYGMSVSLRRSSSTASSSRLRKNWKNWKGEGIFLFLHFASDEFDSRKDIAPLIGAADLHICPIFFIKMQIIVTLKKRVAEFRKGDRRFRIEAVLHDVFLYHRVHGEVLSHVAQEFEYFQFGKPAGVIDF